MKKNYTDISIVLDRSGSMSSIREDTIGGFNSFLKSQKDEPGECALTLAQFDDHYDIVHDGVPVKEVPDLTVNTFVPRGSTALLDAIGRTITATGARLGNLPEDQRPEAVLFVIITDGGENASREFTNDKIKEMITHQTDAYKWQFIFLGANQDAFSVGTNMGIQGSNTMSTAANQVGTQSMYASMSRGVSNFRNSAGLDSVLSDEDREAQRKAGAKH